MEESSFAEREAKFSFSKRMSLLSQNNNCPQSSPRPLPDQIRTPAQDRLKRLQSSLKETQKRNIGETKSADQPRERANLKRKIEPEETPQDVKRSRMDADRAKIEERAKIAKRVKPRIQQTSYEADVEMNEIDVVDQIKDLVRNKKSYKKSGDYSVSVSISSDNKLVIDYSENKPSTNYKSFEDRSKIIRQKNLQKTFYIVIDTNIFCHNLDSLVSLMNREFARDAGYPILVVPYVVLEELDRLKMVNRSLQIGQKARKAIYFINTHFKDRNPQLKGQSAKDQTRHCLEIKSADDHILNCCLQIAESTGRVVLLTNDTNLRNKALFNSCPSFSMDEIQDAEITF